MSSSKAILFGLILFSVASSAVAQMLLKIGMSHPDVKRALAEGPALSAAAAVATNAWVIGGFALYLIGAIVWLLVLARVELSFAYPFVGLGFIVTMILGRFVLGDTLSAARIVGTMLVVSGVLLISLGRP